MDFVLALHSHLPWVLNHGRWPHGSDWLCEAALDTYLPLIEQLRALETERVAAPLTIGVTPVLANQLVSPTFVGEMEAFFAQRLMACDEAGMSLAATGEEHLVPLVEFWRGRLTRLRRLFHDLGGDIVSALRSLEESGRIETITSAATHGFLPLLARDESIRLQLAVGRAEHRRLFGRLPQGIWVPECAYRPRGAWQPWSSAPRSGVRRGIEEHLGDAGFRFFFVDSHLASAGRPLGIYGDPATRAVVQRSANRTDGLGHRSPYRSYEVAPWRSDGIAALVRDPRSSMQVWSRFDGYPGDGAYLEFHKMRWPGGLKLWRVTGGSVDLGDKGPYDPDEARARAQEHAEHFAGLLAGIATSERQRRGGVIVAPFDTELFGHWWFEGPEWLGGRLPLARAREARGAARHRLAPPRRAPRTPADRDAPGSWGANGDFSMWLGEQTALDLGAGLGAGRDLLGRGAGRDRRPRRPPGAGPGRPRDAAGSVVRLAVHHLDRCRSRLRRAAAPASTATTRRRCSPHSSRRRGRASPRRRRWPRSCTSATTFSPISFPPWPWRCGGSRALAFG